jgi:catechol 2,3-dioxygenase-like lactoylglutathione lyase family enzyme
MAVEEPDLRIDDERPDSPVVTSGVDHMTLQGSNEEDTIAFYRDLLGMPLLIRQPHLGKPELTHLFFDTGDGRMLSFFVKDERETRSDRSWDSSLNTGVGTVQHLAFQLERDQLEDLKELLEEIDHRYQLYNRGFTFCLYTRDPNGFVLEFNVDKFNVPIEERPPILARAQELRVEDGADWMKDEHIIAALEELGVDWERTEVPDAPVGRAVDG